MSTLGSFIWSIADQLRGPYRPNQYGNVILPLTILRRLDCILEPDRETVRELAAKFDNPNRLRIEVKKATGRPFYNTSNYSFANLLADADGLADNLTDYIDRFSRGCRRVRVLRLQEGDPRPGEGGAPARGREVLRRRRPAPRRRVQRRHG